MNIGVTAQLAMARAAVLSPVRGSFPVSYTGFLVFKTLSKTAISLFWSRWGESYTTEENANISCEFIGFLVPLRDERFF